MLEDLRGAGLKMTPQRVAIVELFAVDESHPTAQGLFERLQPAFPSMSFATVYNTLDALAKAGLSSTLRLGQAARFDPNTTAHHHTVCDVCGDVRDVPAVTLKSASDLSMPGAAASVSGRRGVHKAGQPGAAAGFAVRTVERIYRGTCGACSSMAVRSPRKPPQPAKDSHP